MVSRTRSLRWLLLCGLLLAAGLMAWIAREPAGAAGGGLVPNASESSSPKTEVAPEVVDWIPTGVEDADPPALAPPESVSEPEVAAPTEARRPGARAAADPRVTLRVRVVDEVSGAPVAGAVATLTRSAQLIANATTDEMGELALREVDGPEYVLTLTPPEGWIVLDAERALHGGLAGPALTFIALRWPPEVAGDIRGRLLSERGAWTSGDLPGRGELVLDLISLAEPRIQRRAVIRPNVDAEGGIELSFEFVDVPRGDYELTLSSLDGFRWQPVSMVVAPPAEALEFLRYDLDRAPPLVFRVVDAETGEAIEDYELFHIEQTQTPEGMFLHAGDLDPTSFPLQGAFTWSLWADGYAPFFGDESSFREEDGGRVVDVHLEGGWAARAVLVARTPVMRPVQGVEVLLDGESAGLSGADGELYLRRPESPTAITVGGGWQVTNDPFAARGGAGVAERGHVLLCILEREE